MKAANAPRRPGRLRGKGIARNEPVLRLVAYIPYRKMLAFKKRCIEREIAMTEVVERAIDAWMKARP